MIDSYPESEDMSEAGFRIRLRFRIGKPLDAGEAERSFCVGPRTVRLVSGTNGQLLKEAKWLVFEVRGFRSEQEARMFGDRLKIATVFSSIFCRLGVDLGNDLPNLYLGRIVVEQHLRSSGLELRNDVHGLDVFPDRGNIRINQGGFTISQLAPTDPFLNRIGVVMPRLPEKLPKTHDAIMLLNAGLIDQEPLARMVLAISAVEMLGQSHSWHPDQRILLERLASEAEADPDLPENQRREVAEAIRRNTYRIRLRQGVLRLLDALALSDLKPAWDDLYQKRSGIFHGIQRTALPEQLDLANRAISMCGRIVLSSAASEGVELPDDIDHIYRA